MVRKGKGSDRSTLTYGGKEIDLEGEWIEIDFIEGLEKATG
jgi:hypothetical protein